jgi:transcriptional regulator with XRE-family HTH domain
MQRTALKLFRIAQKMTQEEFAAKVGFSQSRYGLIEQGNRDGTLKFWNALQKAFNIADADMWALTKIDEE